MGERHVTEITIYPIKSTAGISVAECTVETRGLAMDRRWMVVDNSGDFITGREFPILTQIRSRIEDDGLHVTAPGKSKMHVPFPSDSATSTRVTIWDDECRALMAGAEIDCWFTSVLGISCHLVYMDDNFKRPVDFHYGRPGDHVSFADGYPLVLISSASLADLNARVPERISMARFRPNIVVAGCSPYEEDGWREIRIGDAYFDGVKNCSRCEFTTIDPDTGEKHPRLEPLRTLGSYRRAAEGGVLFGQKLIPRTPGRVRVGDVVELGREL